MRTGASKKYHKEVVFVGRGSRRGTRSEIGRWEVSEKRQGEIGDSYPRVFNPQKPVPSTAVCRHRCRSMPLHASPCMQLSATPRHCLPLDRLPKLRVAGYGPALLAFHRAVRLGRTALAIPVSRSIFPQCPRSLRPGAFSLGASGDSVTAVCCRQSPRTRGRFPLGAACERVNVLPECARCSRGSG